MIKKVPKRRIEKIIVCGQYVEYVRYNNPISVESRERDEESYKQNKNNDKREDSLQRSRRNIRHIIWTNQTEYTKFITLTYENTVLDNDVVMYDFKQFIKKLRRRGYNCPYLYVTEHQKARGIKENNEGCLHIHCVLFSDEIINIKDLNECWRKGITDISACRNINNLGAYVCKYLTKEEFELFGKNSYHVSRGLKKPEILVTDGYIGDWYENHKELLDKVDFHYSNTIDYTIDFGIGQGFSNSILYQQGKLRGD